MKRVLSVLLILLSTIGYSQNAQHLKKVVCYRCDGKKVARYDIDCPNCIRWNAEYRSKRRCDRCQDTRHVVGPLKTCLECVGKGYKLKWDISSNLEDVINYTNEGWDTESRRFWESYSFSVINSNHISYQQNGKRYDFFNDNSFSFIYYGKKIIGNWETYQSLEKNGIVLKVKLKGFLKQYFTNTLREIEEFESTASNMESEENSNNNGQEIAMQNDLNRSNLSNNKIITIQIVLKDENTGKIGKTIEGKLIGKLEVFNFQDYDNNPKNWDEADSYAKRFCNGCRLPNNDELKLLYENRVELNNFELRNIYWSGTQSDNQSWSLNMNTGSLMPLNRDILNTYIIVYLND